MRLGADYTYRRGHTLEAILLAVGLNGYVIYEMAERAPDAPPPDPWLWFPYGLLMTTLAVAMGYAKTFQVYRASQKVTATRTLYGCTVSRRVIAFDELAGIRFAYEERETGTGKNRRKSSYYVVSLMMDVDRELIRVDTFRTHEAALPLVDALAKSTGKPLR